MERYCIFYKKYGEPILSIICDGYETLKNQQKLIKKEGYNILYVYRIG